MATVDGRVLSGLLAENSGGKVTVLDAKGVRTPLRENEVETIKRADTSLMPEGLLDSSHDQELRDVFAYLRSEPAQATEHGAVERSAANDFRRRRTAIAGTNGTAVEGLSDPRG